MGLAVAKTMKCRCSRCRAQHLFCLLSMDAALLLWVAVCNHAMASAVDMCDGELIVRFCGMCVVREADRRIPQVMPELLCEWISCEVGRPPQRISRQGC